VTQFLDETFTLAIFLNEWHQESETMKKKPHLLNNATELYRKTAPSLPTNCYIEGDHSPDTAKFLTFPWQYVALLPTLSGTRNMPVLLVLMSMIRIWTSTWLYYATNDKINMYISSYVQFFYDMLMFRLLSPQQHKIEKKMSFGSLQFSYLLINFPCLWLQCN